MPNFKNNSNNNSTNSGGDDIPVERILSLPVTFGTPERGLAFTALRCFLWPASKFVQDCLGMTLYETSDYLQDHLVASGYSRGLVRYIFWKMQLILDAPAAWDHSSEKKRYLGDYKLKEFFAAHGNEAGQVSGWCHEPQARIDAARKNARKTDAVCKRAFVKYSPELLRILRPVIRAPRTAEDIVQTTLEASLIAHDTSGTWNVARFKRIALDVYRSEPKGRTVQYFDELLYALAGGGPPGRPIPGYVKIALLNTLFDGARLPHEVICFLHKLLTRLPPRDIVETVAGLELFDLLSDSYPLFVSNTTLAESVFRDLFARFDARLDLPFRDVTDSTALLHNHSQLLDNVVGSTRLADYFKGTTDKNHADDVSRWWSAVLEYLKLQAHQPDTPLFLALQLWHCGDADNDDAVIDTYRSSVTIPSPHIPMGPAASSPKKRRRRTPKPRSRMRNPKPEELPKRDF